jgi:hypothetical protein
MVSSAAPAIILRQIFLASDIPIKNPTASKKHQKSSAVYNGEIPRD